MLVLSIIIPKSQEAALTKEWCERSLGGIPHEIILAKDWATGAAKAKGEFICFLEQDCVLGPNYFPSLLQVYKDRPSFRKLAMVAPALGVNSWNKRVYGYKLQSSNAVPLKISPSGEIHYTQIVYLPGALIRQSALGQMMPLRNDAMLDSVNFSIYFWNHGHMIILDPSVVYVSTDSELDRSYHIETPGDYDELTKMFLRELVGMEVEDGDS